MKRLLPASRASVARPRTQTPADRWRPAAADMATTQGAAHFSTTARCFKVKTQAQPRGVYYDVLITNPPPYSNANANEPPVTAQPRAKTTARKEKADEPPKKSPPSDPTSAAAPAAAEPRKATQTAAAFSLSEAPAALHAAKLAAEKAAAREAKQEEIAARARIVFGSRLAGPMERENRLAEIRKRSRRVAGVVLPPKPSEPDNCCMSGCVNCVWDRFRDEMEEWAMANAEVQRRLAAGHAAHATAAPATTAASEPAGASPISMDDDGGGSNTNWSFDETTKHGSDSSWEDEIYKGVPVGIREFMKQEKRLKLKHMQEGTMGG